MGIFLSCVKEVLENNNSNQGQYNNNNNNNQYNNNYNNNNSYNNNGGFQQNNNYNEGGSKDEAKVEELRRQALDYSEKRKECSQNSQSAYQRGDKRLAKTLSDESKHFGMLQDRANQEAAQLIFNIKNSGRPPNEMDLHGLYVEEAMDRVKERLRTVNRGDNLCIIVGKGNHSTNHLAKIKPAVERFLTEQNLRHEFQAGNEGAIIVYF